ncbi:hypothetical protein ACF07B_10530 [Streptomyces sp. NPDC015532]|uniref:hypothetical protein n=1 Tax=Streptomyces sp. NPDC015532 TaxID=3364960 RepID=UPI0036F4F3E2
MHGASGTPGPAGGARIAPIVLKTIVVSTIAYVLTNLVHQSGDELWKIAVSVVIGGSALIIQCMVDFEQRLAEMETGQRECSREHQEHFMQLSEAAGLLRELFPARPATRASPPGRIRTCRPAPPPAWLPRPTGGPAPARR